MITIGTWNVSECVSNRWDLESGINHVAKDTGIEPYCNEILQFINLYDLDLLCLQEFPVCTNNTYPIIELIRINTQLKFCYSVDTYPSFLIDGWKAGIALFSKRKIESADYFCFYNPNISKVSASGRVYKTFDKGLISAKINFDNRILNIITGHAISFTPFGLVAENYPECFYEIINCIERLEEGADFVVAGDFNTEKLFDILPDLKGIVTDSIDGATTVNGNMEGQYWENGRKLDYMLMSSSIDIISSKIIPTFSDHSLCVTQISLK